LTLILLESEAIFAKNGYNRVACKDVKPKLHARQSSIQALGNIARVEIDYNEDIQGYWFEFGGAE
jgi:hypothetical protein